MSSLLALILLVITPADTVRLSWLYERALANHPLQREQQLYDSIAETHVQQLRTRFLPSVAMEGQASYQSDVPSIPVSQPGASPPSISEDQYKVSVRVSQLIYDGGVTARQRMVERANRDLQRQHVSVDLYQLREQINQSYFTALLLDARLASLETLKNDLRSRLNQVQAQVQAGAVLSSNADVLRAELLDIEQRQLETRGRRRAAQSTLVELIGEPLPENPAFALPEISVDTTRIDYEQHPQYQALERQKELLYQQEVLTARQTLPRISTSAQLAYGRPPGMNIFENDLQPFYTAGLNIRWDVWNWHANRHEQQALALRQELIDARQESFEQQMAAAVQGAVQEIRQFEQQIERDQQIVELRERIASRAASQMENGVITATEYLQERNVEHQARLDQRMHRIQLVEAKVKYLTTIGATVF